MEKSAACTHFWEKFLKTSEKQPYPHLVTVELGARTPAEMTGEYNLNISSTFLSSYTLSLYLENIFGWLVMGLLTVSYALNVA